ncbi:Putative transcriptional regulator ArsR family [Planktothrix tepida]|uniref:Transcriptional regulator ArsR family n=2 Tax=Planktothrix TaxID=54304 RepID=A0A9W4CM98_9CYAN|nr:MULTISPECIES: metalloregulator ArsR/SmtB family transcription factor [Planktothrix]CAD5952488.1 Putative transcriptional regulator ArsR family [Planktothrix tepida]CAD5958273.1 Putative transcriptional regulator ArsR family [Planktothrix pseudagardhii]CUR32693.1 putative transcriptional regulator ArsR family [Planktothrix tepida PCC 9214]
MTNSTLKSMQPTSSCDYLQLSPAALALMADFFKVLSEVSRLQIVCCLKSGAKNVTQIIEATGLGQANVSKHLKVLAQAGIVTRTQQGVSVYYEITNPFLFEVCDLVCESLVAQMHQQNQQLEQLRALKTAV